MQNVKQKIMTINFSKKWIKITLHILVWVVLITLPYIINTNRGRPPRPLTAIEEAQFLKLNFVSYLIWITIFYINSYILIPSFFYKKKYLYYGIFIFLSLFIAILILSLFFRLLLPDLIFYLEKIFWNNIPTFLLTIATSTAFITISDRINEEKIILQRDQENMKTELSFLRSQISPHFIFNVLNNIVALVRLKSDELEPTVIKLSGLMQYMLYETDEEKVSIKTETEYLLAYIDLQKQRFGKKVNIEKNFEIENDFDEIEPMLLIPFIENAFKHGVGMIKDPTITINLKTQNNLLTFEVKNKFNYEENQFRDPSSGIGLPNVTRRLNLLYKNEHKLSISKDENWFEVKLSLKLNV